MRTLSGTLDQFMPIQILRLLQSTGATGRLSLVRGRETADVFLIEGRSAVSRTSGLHLRVGDILVDDGVIRPETAEFAAAIQQDTPGRRLGQLLVESGAVKPEQMAAAVAEVQKHVLCNILLWREGEFEFHLGERCEDEDISIDLDLDRLILEALGWGRSESGLIRFKWAA